MRSHRRSGPPAPSNGFTLLELLVVLILLSLAVGVAVPTLSRPAGPRESGLAELLLQSREAAARRGETIQLSIAESGKWTLSGAESGRDGPIRSGQVSPFPGLPLTLIVSPVGSCGFDARSASAAARVPLDPFTCTLTE